MKWLRRLKIPAWLALVFFTGLLVYNGLPYLCAPRTHGFVWEKGALADRPVWMVSLVIHVIAGMVCLLSSLLQFFRPLLRGAPVLHRRLGRIYVASILLFLCPTGFYLAFHAHGGIPGTIGFLILGTLTSFTTWKGWLAMRRKQIQQHMRWMIRSFAMVTTALSFRIEHIVFQEIGLPVEAGFLAALYLSVIGNAFVAECLLRVMQRKPNRNTDTLNHHAKETNTSTAPATRC